MRQSMKIGQHMAMWLNSVGQRLLARWRPLKLRLGLAITVLLIPLAQPFVTTVLASHTFPQAKIPTTYDPTTQNTSVTHLPAAPATKGWKAPTAPSLIPHPATGTMADARIDLSPTAPVAFLGSDGRLEVQIPTGAVTAADIVAAGGHLQIQITQLAPPSGASVGGWGFVSLGTYQLQLVDAHGTLVNFGLRQVPTLLYHEQERDEALDLDHAFVLVNGPRPPASRTAKAPTGVDSATTFGLRATHPTTHDPQQFTLAASLPEAAPSFAIGTPALLAGHPALPTMTLNVPSTTVTWGAYNTVAMPGAPGAATTNLSSGSLGFGLSLDVPAGPGGTLPNIALGYNSAGVSEQHSPQTPAGWVGEGWNLTLGQISFVQRNENATGSLVKGQASSWDDQWKLTDPFGTSAELIPPNINVTTYYDNSNNGGNYTPGPVYWHTVPETHAKIVELSGHSWNNIGDPTNPPCWQVYLPNGVMEQFGCTPDSLQYYPGGPQGHRFMVSWMLNLIVDPQGNQVHVTYQKDSASVNGHTYPRDLQIKTIEYADPACTNTTTICTASNTTYGTKTSWNPRARVSFSMAHSPTRLTNAPANCNTAANVRCDNPKDLSGSGGVAAPLIMTTDVLNEVDVQANTTPSSTPTWNTVRKYQFSYEQNGPTTNQDPATGKQESMAGYLDLTKIQQLSGDGALAYPAQTFTYANQTQYYEDTTFQPQNATFCGPTGNTNTNNQCPLWSQSYDGNSRYLATANNGQGMSQTFTWADARNNTHGVPTGQSPADPLYCTNNQASTSPCNVADDQNWSRIVLTQRQDAVQRSSKIGTNGTTTNTTVTSTTAYTYQLTYPLLAQECGDCVAGMYWGNQNGNDYLDYYNSTFMGFTQGAISLPDGSLEVHDFYATKGYGVYDTAQVTTCASQLPPLTACHTSPFSSPVNALHGHEFEVDRYNQDGTTLIGKTLTSYNTVCPPSGVSGSPSSPTWGNWDGNLVSELNHANPVMACDLQTSQVQSIDYEGQTSNVTTKTMQFTYDNYGRITQAVATSNGGGTPGSPTTIVANTAYVWNDSISASQYDVTGTYLIDLPRRSIARIARQRRPSMPVVARRSMIIKPP